MQRLFVALDIPETIASTLGLITHGVDGARWQKSEQFHITLAFIGNMDRGQQYHIDEALTRIEINSVRFAVEGVGYFGDPENPRVLWAGVRDCGGLEKWHLQITEALQNIGVKLEKRKFRPHVTLARFKKSGYGVRIAPWLAENEALKLPETEAHEFHLYSSEQTVNGPRYQIEASYRIRERSR